MKDLVLSTMLIALGLTIVGFTLGASAWLVSFAFGTLSTLIEHAFALATSIFGG